MSGKTNYAARFKPDSKFKRKLDVVVGLIRRGDTFLLTQRARGVHQGGLWEFPGGKLGLAEAPEAGLIREIKEELGITVGIERFFTLLRYADDTHDVALHVYECSIKSGVPKSMEGQIMDWVTVSQMEKMPMPEANNQIVTRLKLEKTVALGISDTKDFTLGRAGHEGPFAVRK